MATKVLAGALAAGLMVLAPSIAWGHAYVMTPVSRDTAISDLNARAHKTGPCGGSPRIGKPTKFAPGDKVTVKLEETVDHRGCYQVAFSEANDTNWTVLTQINDPDNQAPMVYQMTVTLPTKPCPACTLAVRQIMYGAACPDNPQDPADSPGGTYYSCADICIGDTCTEASGGGTDAGSAADGGSTSSSGGASSGDDDDDDSTGTSSSSGKSKSKKVPTSQPESGGCSTSTAGTSVPLSLLGLAVGLTLVRRRRPRG